MRVRNPEDIARARKRRGFTQRELGYLCGCSQTTIWMLESGRMPTLSEDLALLIAKRLDVHYELLFDLRELAVPKVSPVTGDTRSTQREAVTS